MTANRPLAVTMGEPAGIGPEILAKAWRERHSENLPAFFMLGDTQCLPAHGFDGPVVEITAPDQAMTVFNDALPVLTQPLTVRPRPGLPDTANADAVIATIDQAADLALAGAISGIVTCPIHKATLYQAGFDAPGHTEYLARRCGMTDDDVVMMLAVEGLRVVPLTVHVPLRAVAQTISQNMIIAKAEITLKALRGQFGIAQPRLAIAGLNPHAGENNTIGHEEEQIIRPAINDLEARGHRVSGPHPADSLFHATARTNFDAVLCMYHDQALIPLKTIDFDGGVNITLGLPIVRTSPDHGTAFDIAGTDCAKAHSLIAAIKQAAALAHD